MNNNFKNIVFILISFIQLQYLYTQEYILKEKEETQILSLYIDTDTTKTRSNMGFIRKTFENKNPEKTIIDTCFFFKKMGIDHEYFFQNKMSIEKTKNKLSKHYLIYNHLRLNKLKFNEKYTLYCDQGLSNIPKYTRYHYFPKDSILLEGYFEMIDDSKSYNEMLYEPDQYDEPDPGDWCGTSYLSRSRSYSRDAGGLFSEGVRHGKWMIFDGYGFAKIEEHYNKGIRDGLYTVYDKDNTILYQTKFINGTGKEKIYRNDGSIYLIKHYKEGVIDDTKPITYFYDHGQVAILYDYPNNIIKHFYRDGVLFSTQQTIKREGKNYAHGVYKGYDRQGRLKEQKYDKYNQNIYTIKYDNKTRIETIASGNMLQRFKRGKLKSTQLFDYSTNQYQTIGF